MKTYSLYLDESYDKNKKRLVVAGFAIDMEQDELLQRSLIDVKKLLWKEDYIRNNETVLHCTELMNIRNHKSDAFLYRYIQRNEYKIFNKMEADEIKKTIDSVVDEITSIILGLNIKIFGCNIDIAKYEEYYTSVDERDDLYNIAIECIVGNYVHFLGREKAVGNILYESRDLHNSLGAADVKMYHNYAEILINNKGIIDFGHVEIKNRIRLFNTVSKKEENPGIELADFISFYLLKSVYINEGDKPRIVKTIERKLYNGGFDFKNKDLRNYFGLREFPFDYEIQLFQKEEIRKLRSALKNKKNENNRLNRKINLIIEEKRKIQEQLNELAKIGK